MNKSYKANSCKKTYKPLQELDLIDAFLFGASTEKPQDAEFIAKLIIERATNEKVDKISVVSEKELSGIDISHHGIRMDLYVEEYEEKRLAKVYDSAGIHIHLDITIRPLWKESYALYSQK